MERSQVLDAMSQLKLYGMKAAYDETIATAVTRRWRSSFSWRGAVSQKVCSESISERHNTCCTRSQRSCLLPRGMTSNRDAERNSHPCKPRHSAERKLRLAGTHHLIPPAA